LVGDQFPSVLVNDSANNFFTISGPGRISGSASIVKTNTSTLAIASANNFTGPVDIEQGTLRTDNDAALGTPGGGTTVHDGATLDMNGHNLGGEVVTISGSGLGGQGALVSNGGGNQFQALRQLVLAADATIGGTTLWGINNGGGTASLSTGGSSFSLTKTGGNQVNLAQLASVDPGLADIDIQQGTLEFSGLTSSMGDSSRTNFVRSGATLSFGNDTVTWNKYFYFEGNGSTTTLNNGTGANTELVSSVELHGDCVFNVGGTLLTISGVITGDGGIIKNGSTPLILTNANTYTGDTVINTGALRLNGGSISSSSNVVIALGATLSVTGRVDSTFTVASNQTLKGNGVVNGNVLGSPGSTIAPGIDAIGSLTVSNAVTLQGTTVMELDPANGTNDLLKCNGSIAYGGTLNLVALSALGGGNTFKLFNGTSYSGSFGITPATPGAGLAWDTSALNISGTLKVLLLPIPRFSGISIAGTNLVLSGSNGPPSHTYYVLSSTNVAQPAATWTRIATNSFDSNGNFSFTNSISQSIPKRFFLLQVP
jgi:autotransporter-associated beta strand protein